MKPAYTYAAQLVRAIDGDTVDLDVDLGFNVRAHVRIRLADINCPERGQPGWAEATEFTRAWFAACGDRCIVITAKAPDVYARWLGIIHDPADVTHSNSLNTQLVDNGHAIVTTYR